MKSGALIESEKSWILFCLVSTSDISLDRQNCFSFNVLSAEVALLDAELFQFY